MSDPLPKNYWSVMASVFAMSNMGLSLPSVDNVRRCLHLRSAPMRANEIVLDLAQEYIESDETEDAFREEAAGWEHILISPQHVAHNLDYVRRTWPHIMEVMDAAAHHGNVTVTFTKFEAETLKQVANDTLEYLPGNGNFSVAEDEALWAIIKKIKEL